MLPLHYVSVFFDWLQELIKNTADTHYDRDKLDVALEEMLVCNVLSVLTSIQLVFTILKEI
jgi:hypothetical protein